jgi:predicted transcriptional regulator
MQRLYQIENKLITKKDLNYMVLQKLIELPVIKNGQLLGFIQRRVLADRLASDDEVLINKIYYQLKKPDYILNTNDSIEEITHKINCTAYKIIPVYSENNEYLGTLQIITILKHLISEKDFVINYYENMFCGYGICH